MDSAQSETPACLDTPRARTGRPQDARRQHAAGRLGKAMSPKPDMHDPGESDGRVVPTKGPNNGGQPSAEGRREGGRPRRTPSSRPRPGRSAGPASRAGCSVCGKQHAGQADTVHGAVAPCQCRAAAGQLLRAEAEAAPGGRRRDVAGVCDGPDARLAALQSACTGDVSGAALEARLHRQGRWPTASAGHRGAGGQDRAARGRGGVIAGVRGGLRRVLVWVSAGARAA